MNKKINKALIVTSAVVIIVFFFGLFILCYLAYGNNPVNSTNLTISTSILASSLSLVVLIYAGIIWKSGDTSEAYCEKYMNEDNLGEIEKK